MPACTASLSWKLPTLICKSSDLLELSMTLYNFMQSTSSETKIPINRALIQDHCHTIARLWSGLNVFFLKVCTNAHQDSWAQLRTLSYNPPYLSSTPSILFARLIDNANGLDSIQHDESFRGIRRYILLTQTSSATTLLKWHGTHLGQW